MSLPSLSLSISSNILSGINTPVNLRTIVALRCQTFIFTGILVLFILYSPHECHEEYSDNTQIQKVHIGHPIHS